MLPSPRTSPKRQPDSSAPFPPESKRPRRSVNEYQRHATRWETNGDMDVQIDDVRFRLHSRQLIKLSAWFRDAFGREGTTEGRILVIYLDGSGVTVFDFEVLLETLDHAITFFYSKPEFRILCSLLQSSSALQITEVYTWAVAYLRDMWPTSLEAATDTHIPFPFSSIVLARQHSVPSVLKRALYEIARGEEIVEGGPSCAALSSEAIVRLLRARNKMAAAWVELVSNPLKETPSCCLYSRCQTQTIETSTIVHTAVVHTSGLFEKYLHDPIRGFQAIMDDPGWGRDIHDYCSPCREKRAVVRRRMKEEMWVKLDGWLPLDLLAATV